MGGHTSRADDGGQRDGGSGGLLSAALSRPKQRKWQKDSVQRISDVVREREVLIEREKALQRRIRDGTVSGHALNAEVAQLQADKIQLAAKVDALKAEIGGDDADDDLRSSYMPETAPPAQAGAAPSSTQAMDMLAEQLRTIRAMSPVDYVFHSFNRGLLGAVSLSPLVGGYFFVDHAVYTMAKLNPRSYREVLTGSLKVGVTQLARASVWMIGATVLSACAEEGLHLGIRYSDPFMPPPDTLLPLAASASAGALSAAIATIGIKPEYGLGSRWGRPMGAGRLRFAHMALGAVGGVFLPVILMQNPFLGRSGHQQ